MRIVVSILAAAALTAAACGGSVAWPAGKKTAVVLTYDDALTSQLDHAVPALDKAGLKGTFFLSGADMDSGDVSRWKAAAAHGHELGNHTIFHACLATTNPAPARYTSETYTVETMLMEIAAMNTWLTALDGRQQHSFAYPCGEHVAGGVDYIAALQKAGLVRYVRGIEKPNGHIDPMNVASVWWHQPPTAAQLIDAVKQGEASGEMVVLQFHGVGGDYLEVSTAAHNELVAYLKAHRRTIWVAPFTMVMDYVLSHPAKK